ncbi:unnamed protein product [Adineta ricciae]|uniref:Uncharacterized protein n=1 Tax=Adineta ricciae TaxID=249248 RepID=A0A814V0W0_ADIRI|nr:unnamed protein product [Adineta ricciae]CAF1181861.1 unnamed protein product [Adineta ricciae]
MVLVTAEKQEKTIDAHSFQECIMMEKQRTQCRMKWIIGIQICIIIFVLLLAGLFHMICYRHMKIEQHFTTNIANISKCTPEQNVSKPTPKQNIVSLYAFDPLARKFCFVDGEYGGVILNWTVYNRRSDIDFNAHNKDNFTVGIEGRMVGTIIDLGSSEDLQRRYQYRETVGNGQGFASIHRQNTTLLIRKGAQYTENAFQPMMESDEFFQHEKSGATVTVKLGHIYVLRITDRFTPTFELIVKMLVIAFEPNVSVTIRWEVLP